METALLTVRLYIFFMWICCWRVILCDNSTSCSESSSRSGSDSEERTPSISMCKYEYRACNIRHRYELRTRICGSNGKSFRNICVLKRQSCRTTGEDIRVEHNGTCAKPEGTTESQEPSSSNNKQNSSRKKQKSHQEENDISASDDNNGKSRKKKPKKPATKPKKPGDKFHDQQCRRFKKKGCRKSMTRVPVCGTDRATYRDGCTFWKLSCRKSKDHVTIAHKGICRLSDNELTTSTTPNTRAVTTPRSPVVSSPECFTTCSPGYGFVCGTDGATYLSECHIKQLACRENIVVQVLHRGICRARQRSGGARLPTNNRPAIHTEKCRVCADTHHVPVCGTDAMTYYNACALEEFSCKLNDASLRVQHDGPCQVDAVWNCDTRCKRLKDQEVCGSDGKTYSSGCHIQRRNCNRAHLNLTVLYRGRCKDQANQDPCDTKCRNRYQPICGTDMVTYLNQCFLDRARCRDPAVEYRHDGICRRISAGS